MDHKRSIWQVYYIVERFEVRWWTESVILHSQSISYHAVGSSALAFTVGASALYCTPSITPADTCNNSFTPHWFAHYFSRSPLPQMLSSVKRIKTRSRETSDSNASLCRAFMFPVYLIRIMLAIWVCSIVTTYHAARYDDRRQYIVSWD